MVFALVSFVAVALISQLAAADPTGGTGGSIQYVCSAHPSFSQTYSPGTTCGTFSGSAYQSGFSDFYIGGGSYTLNCKYVNGGACYFHYDLNSGNWSGDDANDPACVVPSSQSPAQPSGGFVNRRRATPAWIIKRASTDPRFPFSCPVSAPGYDLDEAILVSDGFNSLPYTYYCGYSSIDCFYDASGVPTNTDAACPTTLCNTGSNSFRRRDVASIASRQVKAADLRKKSAKAGLKAKSYKW